MSSARILVATAHHSVAAAAAVLLLLIIGGVSARGDGWPPYLGSGRGEGVGWGAWQGVTLVNPFASAATTTPVTASILTSNLRQQFQSTLVGV